MKKTVTINGTLYDHSTGLPLRASERSATMSSHASTVHTSTQRSKALSRRYVKHAHPTTTTPQKKRSPKHASSVHPSHPSARTIHEITKFAPRHTSASKAKHTSRQDITPAQHHPIAVSARTKHAAKKPQPVTHKPSDVLKKEALDHAMSKVPHNHARKHVAEVRTKSKSILRSRLSIASTALALLMLGGYLTYLAMPVMTTRVAAAQAGIDATYPSYHPSGYSLSGPVAYSEGKVTMKFAANAGPKSYTITQSRSAWDSAAVLEQHIAPNSNDAYATTTVGGVTVYTYNTNAAWVNRGIFYTIEGDAPLSGEQLQRIVVGL